MRIIGIDPGYAIVGWGILEYKNSKFVTIDYGAIITDVSEKFCDRLEKIYNSLTEIFSIYKPECMAIDGYGRATKSQVMNMIKMVLNLKVIPKPDDTADALALAVAHAHCSFSRLFIEKENL